MSDWPPGYEKDGEMLFQSYVLQSGNVLRYVAEDIRREKTGVHAHVSITINHLLLASDNFNVERDPERVRLANSAYKHLDTDAYSLDRAEMPANTAKHALDVFCIGLWNELVGLQVGGQMEGNPNAQPADRLVGDYILRDAGSILFAPPGFGKSNTALLMGVSSAYGVEKLWKLGDAFLPLYINVERSAASMAARLARVNQSLGLPGNSSLPFLNARGRSLTDIREAAKRTMDQEGCDWIIYDSISRAGQGSLVNDDVANKVMDLLNGLSGTWLALAHSPRADDAHAYGSQMFDAAADLTIQLKSQVSNDGMSTGVSLEVVKANDIAKAPARIHIFEWSNNGLAAVRPGKPGEFAEMLVEAEA